MVNIVHHLLGHLPQVPAVPGPVRDIDVHPGQLLGQRGGGQDQLGAQVRHGQSHRLHVHFIFLPTMIPQGLPKRL